VAHTEEGELQFHAKVTFAHARVFDKRLTGGWFCLEMKREILPWIWISAIFKKYLQCVLAARILTVDFVVCTLAVEKKNQGRFRYVGSDHSLVSLLHCIGARHGQPEIPRQVFL
jgi:hypothetical protein